MEGRKSMTVVGWTAALLISIALVSVLALIWMDVGLILSGQQSISERINLFAQGHNWVQPAADGILRFLILLTILHFFKKQ